MFFLRGQRKKKACSPAGGGVLPYISYTGMYLQRGRDFEAPDVERGIHFRGVF